MDAQTTSGVAKPQQLVSQELIYLRRIKTSGPRIASGGYFQDPRNERLYTFGGYFRNGTVLMANIYSADFGQSALQLDGTRLPNRHHWKFSWQRFLRYLVLAQLFQSLITG